MQRLAQPGRCLDSSSVWLPAHSVSPSLCCISKVTRGIPVSWHRHTRQNGMKTFAGRNIWVLPLTGNGLWQAAAQCGHQEPWAKKIKHALRCCQKLHICCFCPGPEWLFCPQIFNFLARKWFPTASFPFLSGQIAHKVSVFVLFFGSTAARTTACILVTLVKIKGRLWMSGNVRELLTGEMWGEDSPHQQLQLLPQEIISRMRVKRGSRSGFLTRTHHANVATTTTTTEQLFLLRGVKMDSWMLCTFATRPRFQLLVKV